MGQNIAGFGSDFDVNAVAWLSETVGRWEKISSDAFGGDGWQDMFDLVVMPDGTFAAVGVMISAPDPDLRNKIRRGPLFR